MSLVKEKPVIQEMSHFPAPAVVQSDVQLVSHTAQHLTLNASKQCPIVIDLAIENVTIYNSNYQIDCWCKWKMHASSLLPRPTYM